MISVPIQISRQEMEDFPLDQLEIDSKWKSIIDPSQDYKFQRPRACAKKKNVA